MNKHRGSNFKDYLKERGRSEEVSTLAQKRWEALHSEAPDEGKILLRFPTIHLNLINRLLHRLRYLMNHLFS